MRGSIAIRPLAFALLLAACGCSQEGYLVVVNRTSVPLDATIDGAAVVIPAGGRRAQAVDIGHKFIFGPDEKDVTVTGESDCVWDFSIEVAVRAEVTSTLDIEADAAVITGCNLSSCAFDAYMDPCGRPRGDADIVLQQYDCGVWKVSPGCWTLRGECVGGGTVSASITVEQCEFVRLDVADAGNEVSIPGDGEEAAAAVGGLQYDGTSPPPRSTFRGLQAGSMRARPRRY